MKINPVIKTILLLTAGFLLGQNYMIRAYNPVNLEKNTLNYAAKGFFFGCIQGINKYDRDVSHHEEHYRYCIPFTVKFYNDTKEMWHNKIWENKNE